MIFCYAIKNREVGLLWHVMREVVIIPQAPVASKPKYAKAMLRQPHILDTKVADPIF